MLLDEAVIDRTPEEGARLIALELLRQCDAAAGRLAKRQDEEALHDLRVGLRRLRTTLRSFRPWLAPSVGRGDERKLRRLAKRTNAARDAEVHLAFLDRQRHGGARHQLGVDFMRERLEARRDDDAAVAKLLARYHRLARRLARRLPRYEIRLDADASAVTLGAALAAALRDELAAVRARLGDVSGPGDAEHVHRSRIAVKRLRYLLEPLRGNAHADGRAAVRQLKRLQDVLGDLHDAHTLAGELEDGLVEAAAERARRLHLAVYEADAAGARLRDELRGGPRSGLLALVRVVRERRDELYGELERAWRGGEMEALGAEVERIVAALDARAGGELEIERQYRLSALPPRVEDAPSMELALGWTSGRLVRERLRRVRAADGERYWRGVSHGEGVRRFQAEEETTAEIFDALWPLTEGRRETRLRRELSDGGVTWFIDHVVEGDFIVAEARLPARLAHAPAPGWLAPFVMHELPEPHGEAPVPPEAAASTPGDVAGSRPSPGPVEPSGSEVERPEAAEESSPPHGA